MKDSPNAAAALLEGILEDICWKPDEDLLGETDCPEGCHVEDDGACPHGFKSAALTAGLI
jgi:hypothetical protein